MKLGRILKSSAGYAIAAACLIWLFHDVDRARLFADVGKIDWRWVALAIVFDIAGYVCQGWRWELLLRPAGRVSVAKAAQAIYAGLFTNEILPMRVGEIVRAYLVSLWLGVTFAAVVPSMVVERLFDGVWLAVSIGLVAVFVDIPKDLLGAADILGGVLLAATAVFVFIVFRKREDRPRAVSGPKPLRMLARLMGTLEGGLRQIGRSRALYASFAVSFLLLLSQIVAYWLIMWAYGMRLSFWAGAVVLLIVRLGTAIPNAPANVGTYQFFTVAGLALFGVDKTQAAGFSLVVFFLLTLPLWILGSFALSRSGMTLASVKSIVGRFSGAAREES